MKTLMSYIQAYTTQEDGATALEYGLLAALIAVVIIGAVTTLGSEVSNTFGSVASGMEQANAASSGTGSGSGTTTP